MVGFFFWLFLVLFIFVSLFMILLILIQKGRGGGLASSFGGGGGGNTAFGSKTGDVLTWATSIIFGVFLVLAVILNLMTRSGTRPTAAGNLPAGNPVQMPQQPSRPQPRDTAPTVPAPTIPLAPSTQPAPK